MLQWIDYDKTFAHLVDSWLDAYAVSMTGIADGWDEYWSAVCADAVNFPGCEDFCKVIFENSVPIAVLCYGIFEGTMTVSEIVVSPAFRGKGIGSKLIKELVDKSGSDAVTQIEAVVYPRNIASQKAFQKAGFHLEGTTEDGVDLVFRYYPVDFERLR